METLHWDIYLATGFWCSLPVPFSVEKFILFASIALKGFFSLQTVVHAMVIQIGNFRDRKVR